MSDYQLKIADLLYNISIGLAMLKNLILLKTRIKTYKNTLCIRIQSISMAIKQYVEFIQHPKMNRTREKW